MHKPVVIRTYGAGAKMECTGQPIATPHGWTVHGDLRPGDQVFGPDGRPTTVVAISPPYLDGEAYELGFDDGAMIVAGAGHLWMVERKSRRRAPGAWQQGADKHIYREPIVLTSREIAAHAHRPDNRLAVPVNAPLMLPPAAMLVPPYTLGAWLGDGNSDGARITCAYDDFQVMGEIMAEGISINENRSSNANSGLFILDAGVRGQKGTGMTSVLRQMGLKKNKHIPVAYLRASMQQRMALLQGLMDTDGHCNTRGTATFCNKNEAIIDGVCELATSLGLKATKHTYEADHGRWWQVRFQGYSGFCPFRLDRKAKRCKAGLRPHPRRYIISCNRIGCAVEMRCIQVDRADGLYLTGRAMITTHC